MSEQTAIVQASQQAGNFLAPVVDVKTAIMRYQAVKDFIGGVLREGTDFGKIPGAGEKPTLLKPGAEKMCAFFGFTVRFQLIERVEDWTGKDHEGESFFYFQYRAQLWRGDVLVAEGDGSANSWEKKYRYRQAARVCPACGQPAIIKGKAEYGGGWLCFKKNGGCGAKFGDNDAQITGQEVGQVKNPDVADVVNTLQKMAQKRALIAPVLIATNTSDYFTQDIEDFIFPAEIITEGHATEVTGERPAQSLQGFKQQPIPTKPTTQPRPVQAPTADVFGGMITPALLVERGYAENVPSAVQIINKLNIAGRPAAEFMSRVELYRAHRENGEEPAQAATLAIAGKPVETVNTEGDLPNDPSDGLPFGDK